MRDKLVAIVPKEYDPPEVVTLDRIPYDLYLSKENTDVRLMLDRLFRHADDESIKAAIKNARHSSSVTKMIKQGMGYTLLPLQYAQYTGKDEFNILEDEYNIVEISPAVNVNLNCVFSSSFYSHPTGREFINFFI